MPTRPDIPGRDNPDLVVAQEIFDTIPRTSIVTGIRLIAAGSSANTFRLQWINNDATITLANQAPPIAALIARVVEVGDESGNPGNIRPALNFDYDSRTGEVILYEPLGLTADTKYTLSIMFIAG